MTMPLRFVLFGAALSLMHPGTASDLIGFGIGVPDSRGVRSELTAAPPAITFACIYLSRLRIEGDGGRRLRLCSLSARKGAFF